MKYLPYILCLVLGAAIVILCMKSCKGDSELKSLSDSLKIQILRADSIQSKAVKLGHTTDSVVIKNRVDSFRYITKIDSLNKVCARLKANFLATRDTISNLHNKLNDAFATSDTGKVYRIAHSLNNQLVIANNELFSWSVGRDSSDQAMKDEIVRLYNVIDTLKSQINQFKELLVTCTNNNAALSKTANSAIKKAKARGLVSKIGMGLAALLAAIAIIK